MLNRPAACANVSRSARAIVDRDPADGISKLVLRHLWRLSDSFDQTVAGDCSKLRKLALMRRLSGRP